MSDSFFIVFVNIIAPFQKERFISTIKKKHLSTFLQHQLEIQLSRPSKIQHLFPSKLGLSSLHLSPLIKSFLKTLLSIIRKP